MPDPAPRVTLKNDKEIKRALSNLRDKMPEAIKQAMGKSVLFIQNRVQERKLSGQVLRVRTGRLRSSINTRVKLVGKAGAIGFVGTNVIYARPHELGNPRRGLRARPFLKPAFRENTEKIKAIFKRQIIDFAKNTVK